MSLDTQGSTPSISVRGTVINTVTRQPIGHALVISGDNRYAAFSDDSGGFEFQVPGSQQTQFTARKPGFFDAEDRSMFEQQNAAAHEITLSLVPESLIVGRVNLPSSNQFDRITVQVYGRHVNNGASQWGPVANAVARSNGEFRVANLRAGIYKVFTEELMDRDPVTFDPRGQAYGYPPIYYPAAGDFASAGTITLEAGKTTQIELSPVLQPYYPVRIAMTGADAQLDATISVAPQGRKGPGYELGWGEDGGIAGVLPNGVYTLEATVRQGERIASGTANIAVKGGPAVSSMTVLPNASIPVIVKDETGINSRTTILEGGFSREQKANIVLLPADDFDAMGGFLRPPRKPNDNELVLENVRPGRYWVEIDPSVGYVASATYGGTDLLNQPLVIGAGGGGSAIEVVLRAESAQLEGSVEGLPTVNAGVGSDVRAGAPAGRPVGVTAAGYVYCIPQPDSDGRFTAGVFGPDGRFVIPQLPPGGYRVLAFQGQLRQLEYRNPDAMQVYNGRGPTVRLEPGQKEQVRVPLIVSQD
jgi:hypothetical protein